MSSPSVTDLQPHTAQNPAEFIALLRRLKVRSGLNYRQLEARADAAGDVLPRSTLSAALKRSALPREELLVAFVRACGSTDTDLAEWTATRRRLAEAAVQAPEPGVVHQPDAAAAAALTPPEPVSDANQWAFTWGDQSETGAEADSVPDLDPDPIRTAPAAAATPPPAAPPPTTPPPTTPPRMPELPVSRPPLVAPAATTRQPPRRTEPASHRPSSTRYRHHHRDVPPARQPLPALPPRSERGAWWRALLGWLVPPALARASFPIRLLIAMLVLVLAAAVAGAATKLVRDRVGALSPAVTTATH